MSGRAIACVARCLWVHGAWPSRDDQVGRAWVAPIRECCPGFVLYLNARVGSGTGCRISLLG
jgi:hypothetical protein